jgi:signal transduction histidine kinase
MTAWKKLTDFFRHGGLRRRLLTLGLTLLGTALVINTLAGSYYTQKLIQRDATVLQREIAGRIAFEIDEFMEAKITRLSDYSAAASFYGLGSEEQRVLGLLLLRNDRAFTELSLLNERGRELLKISERKIYPSTELSDRSESEKFKRAFSGEIYVSQIYTSDKAEPHVTLAVPIKSTTQEVIGVVASEANLQTLWDVIGNIRFGQAGYAYLVDRKGNLIAHRDSSLVRQRLNLSYLPEVNEFVRNHGAVDPTLVEEHPGITGDLVISTYAPVKKLGWGVVLEEPVAVALGELRRMQRYAVLLLAVGLIAGAIIIAWASNKITGPIRDLHRGALLIGEGNLDHRVRVESRDEIEELARGFNRMAVELKNSYFNLEQKVEQRTQQLGALSTVTSTVNQSLEIKAVLREVIEKITEIFHFDATRIYLFNPLRTELDVQSSFETQPEFSIDVKSFRRRQGLVGRVAETGQPLIFEDVRGDPRYQALSQTGTMRRKQFAFLAVLPIKAKEKCVGSIVFIGKEARKLTQDEMRLLTSMTDQIGVAAENARLYQETTAKAKELSALYDVAATVNHSMDLNVVLKAVIRKVLDTTNFDAARIYLIDPESGELTLRAHHGLSAEFVATTSAYKLGQGVNGRVAEMGEALIFGDIQDDPQYATFAEGESVKKAGFHTYLSLPLKSQSRILGVMNFLSCTVQEISSNDITLLASMANQIGVALENINLFNETARAAQRLSALFTVTASVSQSLNLNLVLQEVIENIKDIFRFDKMEIYLLNEQGDEFHVKGSFPAGQEYPSQASAFRRGRGILGGVLESGKPLIFEDVRCDSQYRELSETRNAQRSGFSFLAVFPLKAKHRTVGLVLCKSQMPRRLSAEEVRLLSSMIDQVGIAVEKANLFDEAKQKTVELEQLNRDLQAANSAKAEFMAAMSHELRTPLNIIIGNVDLNLDGFFGEINEQQRNSLQKVSYHSKTLLKLISDVLNFAKMEARKGSLDISTFRVEEIVGRAQDFAEQLNRNGNVNILWQIEPGLPPMTTDALKLEEILQNLIGNAFKFTPEGKIEIRVKGLKEKRRVEFVVEDTGIGIKQEDLPRIFETFHQLHEAHTGHYSGVGLGLSIVKKYLELMQGEMEVESEPGRGSSFTVTLPYSTEPVAN